MPDELDPRLEARLRDALHHEADALPFTLTISDLEATRRERRSVRARLRLPGSLPAAGMVLQSKGSSPRPSRHRISNFT